MAQHHNSTKSSAPLPRHCFSFEAYTSYNGTAPSLQRPNVDDTMLQRDVIFGYTRLLPNE